MKIAKPPASRLRKSSAQFVINDANGHRLASAPVGQLAPVRFRIGRILVPMDFSEHSRKALRYARPFAEQFGANLTLLHVIEPVVLPTDFGYVPATPVDLDEQRMVDARKQLAGIAHELGATVPVDTIVRLGRSWKEIVETAKTKHMDLLIIATHGYTGLKYALLGSVAEKIIRHAPCPVLVVRAEEHDFL
jgi:nucleotide-binding universal stress UspA family protein